MIEEYQNKVSELLNLETDQFIFEKMKELQTYQSSLTNGEISREEFNELVDDATDLEKINEIAGRIVDKIAFQKTIIQIRQIVGLLSSLI